MNQWMGAMVVAGLCVGGTGCASDAEKVCKKMGEMMGEESGEKVDKDDMAKCVEAFTKQLEKCEDKGSAVDCYLTAGKYKDTRKCESLCSSKHSDDDDDDDKKGDDDDSNDEPSGGGEFPGCPGSTECMQGCMSKCESAHGPMLDREKMAECATASDMETCMDAANNKPSINCFRTCRGLPPNP